VSKKNDLDLRFWFLFMILTGIHVFDLGQSLYGLLFLFSLVAITIEIIIRLIKKIYFYRIDKLRKQRIKKMIYNSFDSNPYL